MCRIEVGKKLYACVSGDEPMMKGNHRHEELESRDDMMHDEFLLII